MGSASRTSLRQDEAAARSALLEVTSYDVRLDLDRGDSTFDSVSVIDFVSRGGTTFLDLQPISVRAITLDGAPLDADSLRGGRLPLDTTAGAHRLVVEAQMRYRTDGEGLHRAVDPADGLAYVYAMTFLDAAPSIFGCFDQPDLKATWTLHVRAPRGWTVLGNTRAREVETGVWDLEPTLPLPTYLIALVAGPYHVLRTEHDGIALGVSARRSLASHLEHDAEEIFAVTRQCFDEFHRLFDLRYPFGDYHQAFVPEFNPGAMESPGCVTFRDPLVFQSRTVRAQHVVRASTIAHEMAHMWFGDITTPRWWDDLWLNESFAEYLGARVTADCTDFGDVWVTEAHTRRPWGLTADQAPTTHPVAGNGAADADTALQNFDGISYAKGASIIKQLNTRLGDAVFFGGVNNHLDRHRYGNATMADLLSAWEQAGAGDLSDFTAGWLMTAGPDRLELDRVAGVVRRTPLGGHPADRSHTIGVATLGQTDSPAAGWTIRPLVIDAAAVPVPGLSGPVVLDPHLDTWAVTLPDPETLAALPRLLPATADPLLRAAAWNSVRNTFHEALLDPATALALIEATIPSEDTDDGVVSVLTWALTEVTPCVEDVEEAQARISLAAAARTLTAPPGSALQLGGFQRQIEATCEADLLRAWLSGESLPDGVVVDLELRWRLLVRLAVLGATDRDELAAALAAEPTGVSRVEHAGAVAALPDADAKAWAWSCFLGEVEVPNYELEAIGLRLWQWGQEHLTDPYLDRYFAELPATTKVRSAQLLGDAAVAFFPRLAVSRWTMEAAHALVAQAGLDPTLARAVADESFALGRRVKVKEAFVSGEPDPVANPPGGEG